MENNMKDNLLMIKKLDMAKKSLQMEINILEHILTINPIVTVYISEINKQKYILGIGKTVLDRVKANEHLLKIIAVMKEILTMDR